MHISNERLKEIIGMGKAYGVKEDEKVLLARELYAARIVVRALKPVIEDYLLGLDAAVDAGLLTTESAAKGAQHAAVLAEAVQLHSDMMGKKGK